MIRPLEPIHSALPLWPLSGRWVLFSLGWPFSQRALTTKILTSSRVVGDHALSLILPVGEFWRLHCWSAYLTNRPFGMHLKGVFFSDSHCGIDVSMPVCFWPLHNVWPSWPIQVTSRCRGVWTAGKVAFVPVLGLNLARKEGPTTILLRPLASRFLVGLPLKIRNALWKFLGRPFKLLNLSETAINMKKKIHDRITFPAIALNDILVGWLVRWPRNRNSKHTDPVFNGLPYRVFRKKKLFLPIKYDYLYYEKVFISLQNLDKARRHLQKEANQNGGQNDSEAGF